MEFQEPSRDREIDRRRTNITLCLHVITVLVLSVLCFFSSSLLLAQYEERKLVKDYLLTHRLTGLPICSDSIWRVVDAVRSDFETNEKKWRKLSLVNRPFLRHDTKTLLSAKEGLCGEGTRVLLNLLQSLGYDATRIVFYDKNFVPVHALVSVQLRGEEYLIDSINSPPGLYELLRSKRLSTSVFKPAHQYDDIMANRRERADLKKSRMPLEDFGVTAYSYEALPVTKIARRLGADVQVFSFVRPPFWVSWLAEKPNLVMAILLFVLILAVFAVSRCTVVRIRRRYKAAVVDVAGLPVSAWEDQMRQKHPAKP